MASVRIALCPASHWRWHLSDRPLLIGNAVWGIIVTLACGLILVAAASGVPRALPMLALGVLGILVAFELFSGVLAKLRNRSATSTPVQAPAGCRVFVHGRPDDVDQLLSRLSAARPARSSWYFVPPRAHANAGCGLVLVLLPTISGNMGLAGPLAVICFAVALLPIVIASIMRRRWIVRDGTLVEESCGPIGRHRVHTVVPLENVSVLVSVPELTLFVVREDIVVATVPLELLLRPCSLVVSVVAAATHQD